MTFNPLKEATVSIQVLRNFIVASFSEATLDIYLLSTLFFLGFLTAKMQELLMLYISSHRFRLVLFLESYFW